MKAASIAEIKQELASTSNATLVNFCLRLAKFKKENKELLTYLLFEKQDEQAFIEGVKKMMEEQFSSVNYSHVYYAKKSIRKILRDVNKYCRYSGIVQTEVELRLHFCGLLKNAPIKIHRDKSLSKLYNNQADKIRKLLSSMHEDLQYDYQKELEKLL